MVTAVDILESAQTHLSLKSVSCSNINLSEKVGSMSAAVYAINKLRLWYNGLRQLCLLKVLENINYLLEYKMLVST